MTRTDLAELCGNCGIDRAAILPGGLPTSSSTMPGLVVTMDRHATLADDNDVLDVGTGSGYGYGLLTRPARWPTRQDFWATTSNKQLNFVQHVKSLLTINGRAAVVVPDNVLFEGGSGETIRRKLLRECDLHTLLRLPTGIFYAGGVKANVLFFDRKPPSERPWTDKLWIYDFRTNQRFTLKTRALVRADLDDFVACYNPGGRHERVETERFRAFSYDELVARDKASLDIFWLRDESLEDSANLPAPEVIAAEIVEDLQAALDQFAAIAASLGGASAQAELGSAASRHACSRQVTAAW